MLKYEIVKSKIDEVMQGYSNLNLDEALTREEFNKLLGTNITGQDWNDSGSWQNNEYGTSDFNYSIDTITESGEEITIRIILEVNNDLITHIVDVDEF